jgi:cytidine deaminase
VRIAADSGAFDALATHAFAAMERAYAPYSRFRVGAALEDEAGAVHHGCNVENASYPVGMCAERGAIARAVAEGARRFTRLVIATEAATPTPPCGMCRQALVEFAPRLEIESRTRSGAVARWRLDELLTHAFTPDALDA